MSVHISSHFFALNDRRDQQTELRIAAPWKSTTSIKQQKKEERLHSKRSPCKNRDGKIFATKCRQKNVCGSIALLAMLSMSITSLLLPEFLFLTKSLASELRKLAQNLAYQPEIFFDSPPTYVRHNRPWVYKEKPSNWRRRGKFTRCSRLAG